MKLLFAALLITAFAACNNGGTKTPGDSTSVKFDTAPGQASGTMNTDTTNVKSMNVDTAGMSQAR